MFETGEYKAVQLKSRVQKQEEDDLLRCPRCSHGTLSLMELDLDGNRIYTCVGDNDESKVSLSTYCMYPFDDDSKNRRPAARFDNDLTPDHFIVSKEGDPAVTLENLRVLLKPIR